MDPLQRFGEYASEFEKTYEDDDWARLESFFHPDVTYVVSGSTFDCELRGRATVLSGIKKALDGFDRRFERLGFSWSRSGVLSPCWLRRGLPNEGPATRPHLAVALGLASIGSSDRAPE